MPEEIIPRADHLAWCKQRALEYCGADDVSQAFASFVSDLRKHPLTADHSAIELMGQLFYAGHLDVADVMAGFIEGFH